MLLAVGAAQFRPMDVALIRFDQRNALVVEPSTQTVRHANIATDGIPRELSLAFGHLI